MRLCPLRRVQQAHIVKAIMDNTNVTETTTLTVQTSNRLPKLELLSSFRSSGAITAFVTRCPPDRPLPRQPAQLTEKPADPSMAMDSSGHTCA